jgi:periplasmic protein TonB
MSLDRQCRATGFDFQKTLYRSGLDWLWEAVMKLRKSAFISVSLSLLAAPAAAAAPASGGRDAEAAAALGVYPSESLAAGEQGIVSYHVVIDGRGHATECSITGSSGHERLDLATCRLLMDRARFTPSDNGHGRRARSTYDGKVVWRIG